MLSQKKKKKKAEKKSAPAGKQHEDFDWVARLEDGSRTKQTIAVLDKYLRHHNKDCQGRKKAKLNEVQRHITNHLAVTQNPREQDSDTDESEEDEVVTCDENDDDEDILVEIGSEHEEEEEYEEHQEGDKILYLDYHGITMNVTTRSGRNGTRFFSVSLRSVSCNSGHVAIQVALVLEEGLGIMINYANYFRGSTFFLPLECGGSPQDWYAKIKMHQPSPAPPPPPARPPYL